MKHQKIVSEEEKLFDDGGPTGLENVTISDRAAWLDDDPRVTPWIKALEKADRRGDMASFLAVLKGSLPAEAFPFIKDFFDRHQLAKKRGRPLVPLYDRSPKEAILEMAVEDLKAAVAKKQKAEAAAEGVAIQYSIEPGTLLDAYRKKRGSTARMNARRRRQLSLPLK